MIASTGSPASAASITGALARAELAVAEHVVQYLRRVSILPTGNHSVFGWGCEQVAVGHEAEGFCLGWQTAI